MEAIFAVETDLGQPSASNKSAPSGQKALSSNGAESFTIKRQDGLQWSVRVAGKDAPLWEPYLTINGPIETSIGDRKYSEATWTYHRDRPDRGDLRLDSVLIEGLRHPVLGPGYVKSLRIVDPHGKEMFVERVTVSDYPEGIVETSVRGDFLRRKDGGVTIKWDDKPTVARYIKKSPTGETKGVTLVFPKQKDEKGAQKPAGRAKVDNKPARDTHGKRPVAENKANKIVPKAFIVPYVLQKLLRPGSSRR